MKRIFFTIAVLAFTAFAFKAGNELKPGDNMPNATDKLLDVSGTEVSLTSSMGTNGLLVMFSCNTCPYVIGNQERTIEVCKIAKAKNFGVIILNSNEGTRKGGDSYEAMKEYAKKQGYDWNYVVDKNNVVANAFGAMRTPEVFLFDNKSKLIYHGAIDDNPSDASAVTRKHLATAIDEAVSGKTITVKTSRSVGCSIKKV